MLRVYLSPLMCVLLQCPGVGQSLCTPPSVKTTAAIDVTSRCLIREGNYAGAVRTLKAANTPLASSELLTLDMAVALGKAALLDDAAQVLTDGLRVHPGSKPLGATMVKVLVQQSRFLEAEQTAKRLMLRYPTELDLQRLYLNALVLNHHTELATPLAVKLLKAQPQQPELLFLRGLLARQAGDLPLAKQMLEASVAADATKPEAEAQLGGVLLSLHDNVDARQHLERALQLGDIDPATRFALANTLKAEGDAAGAQQQLAQYQDEQRAYTSAKVAETKASLAAAEMRAKHPQQAAALYRQALEATPHDATLAYRLSSALGQTGDIDGEQAALQQAIALDPKLAVAQNQLGYLASQAGDMEGAATHFQLAVVADPTYVDAWVSLSASLAMQQKLAAARDAAAHALRLDPQNTQAISLNRELNQQGPR